MAQSSTVVSTTVTAGGGGGGGGQSQDCYSSFLALNTYLLNSSRYNSIMPPYAPSASSSSLSISVGVTFLLIRFISLSYDGVLNVAGALDMVWIDQQLSWSGSTYQCVHQMPFYASTVWNPYVFLQSSATSTIKYSMDDSSLIVRQLNGNSNGRIYGTFSTTCTLDLSWFPYDSQSCQLNFLNYDMSYINWQLSNSTVFSISGQKTASTSEWNVLSMTANTTTTSVYVGGSFSSTPVFYITFNLKRKTIYYTINLLAPTIVMWVMIALTFVLPTDRGMKVPLTVTLMLAIYTQQKNVSNLLPSTTPVPYIVVLLLWGLYLGALSLAAAVITVLFRVLAPKLPFCCQVFMINVVGRFCCTTPISTKTDIEADSDLRRETEMVPLEMLASHGEELAKSKPEMFTMITQLSLIGSSLNDLIRIKKDKIKKTKLAALNEHVWQKIEFLFNAIILIIYVSVMIYFFVTYSVNAGASLL